MMCLTLTQPWASLMAIGAKRIETRSWKWPRRGLLAIHAAKGWTVDDQELCRESPFCDVLRDAGLTKLRHVDEVRGHIVCVVRLVDVVPIVAVGEIPWIPSRGFAPALHEVSFGGYAPGRYAWATTDLVRLATPIKAIGRQGVWTIEDALVQAGYPQEGGK